MLYPRCLRINRPVYLLACLFTALLRSVASAQPQTGSLDDLLKRYLETDAAGRRSTILLQIERVADGSCRDVSDALRKLDLWSAPAFHRGMFDLALVGKRTPDTVRVAYRLPPDYDSKRAYPLIFCLPDTESDATETIRRARKQFDGKADRMILVCPTHAPWGKFHRDTGELVRLATILRATRRRFHIDNDRIYLFGDGRGGEASWLTALMHGESFAAAMTLRSYPPVPYAEQVYPFLLTNLQNLPVYSIWEAPTSEMQQRRTGVVALYNRRIHFFSKQLGLAFHGIEQPRDVHGLKDLAMATEFLSLKRKLNSPRLTRWFRYSDQADAGWVSGIRTGDGLWTDSQLAILPGLTTDRSHYVSSLIQSKLGLIELRLEAQTISIKTQHVRRLELRLSHERLDLDRPITVLINGRVRHERIVRESIRTLLQYAFGTWTFEHLPTANLSFAISHD